jgi:hypothetical protein
MWQLALRLVLPAVSDVLAFRQFYLFIDPPPDVADDAPSAKAPRLREGLPNRDPATLAPLDVAR